jgi:hypothetical protein
MICEIKYPDMTKKTSTPMNPPDKVSGKAWYMITKVTAIVLKPSISGR